MELEKPEGQDMEEKEGEPEEERSEAPQTPSQTPASDKSGWLSKLIWLVILVLIVWGGWTAYKRGTAQDAAGTEPETGTAETNS